MQGRLIKDRKLSLPANFLRWAYRQVKVGAFPQQPSLRQIVRGGIKYLVWTNEDIGKELLLRGSYETNTILAFQNLVRKGDVCIDVGGNIGYFSMQFARMCGSEGRVFVFEPVRRNALLIELSAYLNDFSNIHVHHEVVSEQDGWVDFVATPDSAYSFIKIGGKSATPCDMTRCRSTTLDAFLEQDIPEKRIGVVKIDVEGAEGLVLRGMQKLLSKESLRPRAIMLELVDEYLESYGSNSLTLISMLSSFGYRPFLAGAKGRLHSISMQNQQKIFNYFFIQTDEVGTGSGSSRG